MARRTSSTYQDGFAITPHDSNNYGTDLYADAIWVGGAGVVVLVKPDGNTLSFTATAGTIIPVKSKRVNSTSTTATLLIGLVL